MKPSEIFEQNRPRIRDIVALHRAANARVFGSVLKRSDTSSSDLDLLVDALPGATLFDLGAIQIEIEQSLGIAVDVVTPGDLPMRFREQILKEAVPV